MKKVFYALFILLFIGVSSYAQKKNGTVYSEHKYIDQTKAAWEAFVKGDGEKFISFFADSISTGTNGLPTQYMPAKNLGGTVAWWDKEFENLAISDAKPASPDMLDLKEGLDWVQDWLLLTGRHINTGINIEIPVHSVYGFNDNGKIAVMIHYFDDDILEEIDNSMTVKKNGEVYINHPYIVTVRKMVNAYQDRDVEKWAGFFSPKAWFGYSWLEYGKTMSLEEVKKSIAESLSNTDYKFKIEQVGYPDCIHYEKGDMTVVYSWWKNTIVKDGKKYTYPLMLAHTFNKDGKIVNSFGYYSSNHLNIK